jgi:hypothetical protein
LTQRLDGGWINEWKAAEHRALVERGEALDIYEVQTSTGGWK